jgi:hypothetical protein
MKNPNDAMAAFYEKQAAELIARLSSGFDRRHTTSAAAFARAAITAGVLTLFEAQGEKATRAVVDALVKAEAKRYKQES